ncbi:AlpA family transcriptional regulator [Cryobacterium sp. TMT3-29-2]|uniref:helix-turn-helix transcriptional regulator n=1 Tax=Cryobacterium sp. TMT3-29-2 TaxID=2555867 RepID=UPI001074905F|nr:helix-turn-helix domain-containing protein [Cryobacterium sp. TMT3-29-2]TFC83526.1 DNA-binding protein [Cryobacterium sp. TMT3-29-2]
MTSILKPPEKILAKWLSAETLAGELFVPKQTIYRWRHEGAGPKAHKFGSTVRFARDDVDAWIQDHAE